MPRDAITGVFTRVSNSFSNPVFGTLIDPTDAEALFDDQDVGLNPPQLAGPVRVVDALQVGTTGSAAGTVAFFNATSGSITLSPPTGALGSSTLTLPAATDTLVGKATTDALTNKTVNGNTFTSGTYTLTGAAGKTFTFSNTLTIAGTDGSTLNIGTGGTLTGSTSSAIFYDNIPQNSQSAAYGIVAGDAQKHIFHPSADTTARTWTIPANASVPFPIGTAISFINQNAGGVITIAITSDTMRLAGPGTTGSRSLAANGIATAIKVTSTEWIISGTGLT